MSNQRDPFAPAVHRAYEWLAYVDEVLATGNRAAAYRILRAWLHTVRDRVPVSSAAALSAQLPELLRGAFFEGWRPGHVPVNHRPSSFVTEFAAAAGVGKTEVPALAGLVTEALYELFSPGQLDHVFATLPVKLRRLLTGSAPAVVSEPASVLADWTTPEPELDLLALLEDRVRVIGDAVSVLARGLEDIPTGLPGGPRRAGAAQEAYRILAAPGVNGDAARSLAR